MRTAFPRLGAALREVITPKTSSIGALGAQISWLLYRRQSARWFSDIPLEANLKGPVRGSAQRKEKHHSPKEEMSKSRLAKGDVVDLDVVSPSENGFVGRYGDFVVFVKYACTGERLKVRIEDVKGTYATAKVLAILEESQVEPKRISSEGTICPLYQQCGGCDLMHLTYTSQLLVKHRLVVDSLQRIGKFAKADFSKDRTSVNPTLHKFVDSVIPSPQQFGFRNRVKLQLRPGRSRAEEIEQFDSNRTKLGTNPNQSLTQQLLFPSSTQLGPYKRPFRMGYFQNDETSQIIDTPACPLAQPEVNAKIRLARDQPIYLSNALELVEDASGQTPSASWKDCLERISETVSIHAEKDPMTKNRMLKNMENEDVHKSKGGYKLNRNVRSGENEQVTESSIVSEEIPWKLSDFIRPQSPVQISFRNNDFGSWIVPAGAFFQTNLGAVPPLVSTIRKMIHSADLIYRHDCKLQGLEPSGRVLLDLHCGVGLFALALSLPQRLFESSLAPLSQTDGFSTYPFFSIDENSNSNGSTTPRMDTASNSDNFVVERYVGAEVNGSAIRAARENATRFGLESRGDFFLGDVSGFLKLLRKQYESKTPSNAYSNNDQTNALSIENIENSHKAKAEIRENENGKETKQNSFLFKYEAALVHKSLEQSEISEEIKSNWRFGKVWSQDALTMIVDPPRAGLPLHTTSEILRIKPYQIIYVSCNPATLARDLSFLCGTAPVDPGHPITKYWQNHRYPQNGGLLAETTEVISEDNNVLGRYAIAKIAPLDMFPHSHHVEVIVDLRLVSK